MSRRRAFSPGAIAAAALAALAALAASCAVSKGAEAGPVAVDLPTPATASPSSTPADAATAAASVGPPTKAGRWEVFDGDTLVLEISSEPGPLTSTAMPPPDPAWRPPTHPFLSASARSAVHESKLRGILEASKGLDEFLKRLRDAGFRVAPQ